VDEQTRLVFIILFIPPVDLAELFTLLVFSPAFQVHP
jgi:hypothetical protein